MNVSLYHAASALNANDRWQELIAENLASSSTPGYRKQDISFAAVQAGYLAPGEKAGPASTLPVGSASTSFRAGELRYTGAPTDVAVEGRAFFEVQLPNGAIGYTRDGEFHISAQGQLVTKQGHLVLGDGGPIEVDMDNPAPLSIAATGEVSQGADAKGSLRLTEFQDEQRLTQISGGTFLALDPSAGARPAMNSTVRQGWIEGANTSAVAEMANLITAMRAFEANQKVIQAQDDRMSKSINELGAP